MARLKYTVTVYNYQFNPPSQLTETEYNYYKQLVKADPKAKLNSKLKENPIKKGLRIAAMVALSPLFLIIPGEAEGAMKSAVNKSRANREENEFYEALKEMVIKSNSFSEFASMVKKKYKCYQ
ncbi:MAG: hypothetical protein ACOVJ8_04485 [Sediminibacterium sp.]